MCAVTRRERLYSTDREKHRPALWAMTSTASSDAAALLLIRDEAPRIAIANAAQVVRHCQRPSLARRRVS
jgi:hypothetical protein